MGKLPISNTCHLRPVEPSDAAELHALIVSNRDLLRPWLPWAAGQTLEDTVEFIAGAGRQLAENNGFQAAIVEAGSIAGVVGYPAVDWGNRKTHIGYWLARDRQGRGTMTDAVRVMVEHALGVWDLDRVEICAAVENRRSRAIPERLGFRDEGTFRKSQMVGGRSLDIVVYSMLRGEWR